MRIHFRHTDINTFSDNSNLFAESTPDLGASAAVKANQCIRHRYADVRRVHYQQGQQQAARRGIRLSRPNSHARDIDVKLRLSSHDKHFKGQGFERNTSAIAPRHGELFNCVAKAKSNSESLSAIKLSQSRIVLAICK